MTEITHRFSDLREKQLQKVKKMLISQLRGRKTAKGRANMDLTSPKLIMAQHDRIKKQFHAVRVCDRVMMFFTFLAISLSVTAWFMTNDAIGPFMRGIIALIVFTGTILFAFSVEKERRKAHLDLGESLRRLRPYLKLLKVVKEREKTHLLIRYHADGKYSSAFIENADRQTLRVTLKLAKWAKAPIARINLELIVTCPEEKPDGTTVYHAVNYPYERTAEEIARKWPSDKHYIRYVRKMTNALLDTGISAGMQN